MLANIYMVWSLLAAQALLTLYYYGFVGKHQPVYILPMYIFLVVLCAISTILFTQKTKNYVPLLVFILVSATGIYAIRRNSPRAVIERIIQRKRLRVKNLDRVIEKLRTPASGFFGEKDTSWNSIIDRFDSLEDDSRVSTTLFGVMAYEPKDFVSKTINSSGVARIVPGVRRTNDYLNTYAHAF